MVALAIGTLLLAGVVQIFVGNKESYRFQQALSRVEETGRYSVSRISRDMRMAGYQGCGGSAMEIADYRKNPPASLATQFTDGVRGFTVDSVGIKADNPPLLKDAPVTPDAGSEGLVVSRMSDTNITFEDTDPPAIAVKKDGDKDREAFKKCDVVFMVDRDCGFGRAFVAGSSENAAKMNFNGTGSCATGNVKHKGLSPGWPGDTGDSRALKVERFIYYIKTNDNGEPTLHRWTGNGQGTGKEVELVEGVEAMHVEYGVDTGKEENAVDEYKTVDSVSNWDKVLAARVSFLVRSRENNITETSQTVSWPPGKTFTPADTRLRQVFTTTIAFRNRLP
jgi:type IV pilus assembly protein PilW